jgi:hypothetical protein
VCSHARKHAWLGSRDAATDPYMYACIRVYTYTHVRGPDEGVACKTSHYCVKRGKRCQSFQRMSPRTFASAMKQQHARAPSLFTAALGAIETCFVRWGVFSA